jgi:anthranilate phosphoribosyltransferase
MLLQTERAIVVSGDDGLDEITLGSETHVTEVRGARLNHFTWTPADFGVNISDREGLLADSPEASAKMIRDVLDGRHGPARDIVVLNAAAALWLTADDGVPFECAGRAAEAIDTGAARDLLVRLAEVSSA